MYRVKELQLKDLKSSSVTTGVGSLELPGVEREDSKEMALPPAVLPLSPFPPPSPVTYTVTMRCERLLCSWM